MYTTLFHMESSMHYENQNALYVLYVMFHQPSTKGDDNLVCMRYQHVVLWIKIMGLHNFKVHEVHNKLKWQLQNITELMDKTWCEGTPLCCHHFSITCNTLSGYLHSQNSLSSIMYAKQMCLWITGSLYKKEQQPILTFFNTKLYSIILYFLQNNNTNETNELSFSKLQYKVLRHLDQNQIHCKFKLSSQL